MKGFCRSIAPVMAAALLLCGCQNDNDNENDHIEDIDLVGDISEDITTTAAASVTTTEPPAVPTIDNISSFSAFIMSENPSIIYKKALGEENCIPGYMYIKGPDNAVYPLLDMHFSADLGIFQSDAHAYAVNDEDGSRVLKIDKLTGEYKVIYEAKSGIIDKFRRSKYGENDKLIYYLTDGNRIVRIYRDSDRADVIAESESGIAFVHIPGDIEHGTLPDSYYICEECSEKGDYALWGDNDGNIYWYHCHTGENMMIDDPGMWELKVNPSNSEAVGASNELNDLYFFNIYNGREMLITEDAPHVYIIDDTAIIEAEKGEGSPCILAVNIPARETEIVYTPQYGDIETVLLGYRMTELDETHLSLSDHVLIIKDGDYLVSLTVGTPEAKTLFHLDNGMSDSLPIQFISEREHYWIYSAGNAIYELDRLKRHYDEWLAEDYPDMDFSSFYYCEDCIDDPDAFYWKDGNGDFWWYHAHSGENEPINVDDESYWISGSYTHFITRKNQ